MQLNTKKTNYMIFNFSSKFKFNTRLKLKGGKLDQVNETKLLGLVLRDDLSWKSNTQLLVKKYRKAGICRTRGMAKKALFI